MSPGCPRAGRARYVCVKLSKETHEWWVEAKHCFQMNSDDAMANRLLELATRSTCGSTCGSTVNSNDIAPEAHRDLFFLSASTGRQFTVSDMTQR